MTGHMRLRAFGFAAMAIASLSAAGLAHADSVWDVESARANARAGGPVSEHDAFLLERYGALSGTPEWRHRVRDRWVFEYDYPAEKRWHRKHRRRALR